MDFQKHRLQQQRAEDSFRDIARMEFEESVWPEWLALIKQRIEEAKNKVYKTNPDNSEYLEPESRNEDYRFFTSQETF